MRRLLFVITLFFCFATFTPAFALETYKSDALASKEEGGPYFTVRQDKFRSGSVLVSRPNQTDITVLDMLNSNGIRTLEDYTSWLTENIKYEKDSGSDAWAMPEETLLKKRGDCDDYAFLNAAVLNVLGYRARVLGLNGVRTPAMRMGNHAICVFEKDGRFRYFDNGKLKLTETSSLEEFLKYISARFHCLSVSQLRAKDKNQEKELLYTKYAQSF